MSVGRRPVDDFFFTLEPLQLLPQAVAPRHCLSCMLHVC